VDDIDKKHERSLVYCPKIAREMDIYHRKHEEKYHPKPTYLTTIQTDINEKMRSILVDWLVEVGEEYNLDIRTLHKGVSQK
jgi:cyclin A